MIFVNIFARISHVDRYNLFSFLTLFVFLYTPDVCQVSVMTSLQLQRQQSTLFQGRYGAVTMRDLIKWGHRQARDLITLADDGYMLLAEKLRRAEEKEVVLSVLRQVTYSSCHGRFRT